MAIDPNYWLEQGDKKFFRNKDPSKAIISYQLAIEALISLKDPEREVLAREKRIYALSCSFIRDQTSYLKEAEEDADKIFKFVQTHNFEKIDTGKIYFYLGVIQKGAKHYSDAANNLNIAVSQCSQSLVIKGIWQSHYGEALYLSGQKDEGKRNLIESLQKVQSLQNDNEDNELSTFDVLEKLARLLHEDDRNEGRKYFEQLNSISSSKVDWFRYTPIKKIRELYNDFN